MTGSPSLTCWQNIPGSRLITATHAVESSRTCAPFNFVENMTNNIQISVDTQFVEEQSEPAIGRYVFAYTITIANQGTLPARLISRHWIITDANGKVQEVRGEGVVGEQPHLNPGETFRYSSGAVLETPVGSMQGSYQMKADDGNSFKAPIMPFTLAVPGILQ